METYHKIETVYARDPSTKQLTTTFRNPLVEILANQDWIFTEKIDGTNIRIHWDGHKVEIAGRTHKSEIPNDLRVFLENTFCGEANEEIFEQYFGDIDVILFGEGYGGKIQHGSRDYRADESFILFDVKINGVFLSRDGENLKNIASYFNISTVNCIMTASIYEGINFIKKHPKSTIGTGYMEGIVGTPVGDFYDRLGNRIIVKIKYNDFKEN